MKLGLDLLLERHCDLLKGKRLGILAHSASLDSNGVHIIDRLIGGGDWQVTTLLGPEHGLTTHAQDMEPVKDGRDPASGLKIYSLYGDTYESLKPTAEMLSKIDTLVVDLQDIGSRYYTYIYTMAFCMTECAKLGIDVIVCDRPNPINGIDIEGGLVEKGFESFVGVYPIAIRHGMTIGELSGYFNNEHSIGCKLHVVRMDGWQREYYWNETGITWMNPSPNMRSLDAAHLYPGMCLLEATNVSEGRGFTKPFEVCGAPWIDAAELKRTMDDVELAGIEFIPTSFTPLRQKYTQNPCHGLQFRITDRSTFKPLKTGLALIFALYNHSDLFRWRSEPYEFIANIPAIDLLTGSAAFRRSLETNRDWNSVNATIQKTPESFITARKKHLLY